MKDYSYHKKVIDDVITKLNESDIDLYLIITAEGCDPMTEFIPGVDTVGSSAFLFTKDGKRRHPALMHRMLKNPVCLTR